MIIEAYHVYYSLVTYTLAKVGYIQEVLKQVLHLQNNKRDERNIEKVVSNKKKKSKFLSCSNYKAIETSDLNNLLITYKAIYQKERLQLSIMQKNS